MRDEEVAGKKPTITEAVDAWRALDAGTRESVAWSIDYDGKDAGCKQSFVHERGSRCVCVVRAEAMRVAAALLRAAVEVCKKCGGSGSDCSKFPIQGCESCGGVR